MQATPVQQKEITVNVPPNSFTLHHLNVTKEVGRNTLGADHDTVLSPVTEKYLDVNSIVVLSDAPVNQSLQKEVDFMNNWLAKAAENEIPFVPGISKAQKKGNIPRIGNNDSRIASSDMCRLNSPSLIFIVEPIVAYSSIPNWYWRTRNVTRFSVNKRDSLITNLWAVWGADCIFTVIFFSSQCLVLEHICNETTIYIVGVYASTS